MPSGRAINPSTKQALRAIREGLWIQTRTPFIARQPDAASGRRARIAPIPALAPLLKRVPPASTCFEQAQYHHQDHSGGSECDPGLCTRARSSGDGVRDRQRGEGYDRVNEMKRFARPRTPPRAGPSRRRSLRPRLSEGPPRGGPPSAMAIPLARLARWLGERPAPAQRQLRTPASGGAPERWHLSRMHWLSADQPASVS